MNKINKTENKLSRANRIFLLATSTLVLMGLGQMASATLTAPQTIVLQDGVLDERGQTLRGNDSASTHFGLSHIKGDLVQVLLATDGIVYAPATDGTPDARNTLLATYRIGNGTQPFIAEPGKFSASLAARPGGGARIFVRVFNAANLEEASFYGDSQVFTLSSWKSEIFVAEITATDKALDQADADADGLSNSMEASLGTDENEADTDGDGMSDSDEQKAGTDALDESDHLQIANIIHIENGEVTVKWASATGIRYRIEAFTNLNSLHDGDFEVKGRITAASDSCSLTMTADHAGSFGMFRVVIED